jgi:hypothetical protein
MNFTRTKPLPVSAMAVSKPWAVSCELTCSQSSSLIAQNIVEKNKINKEKPLLVPAMAVSKPRAISCELKCSQTSSLIAQSSRAKLKFYKQKTTASTGSGCEQA